MTVSQRSEIVLRELLRQSADCSEVGETIRRLRNCTADRGLELLVGSVLAIVEDLDAELAEIDRDAFPVGDAEIEVFRAAWEGMRPGVVGPITMPTEGMPIPLGGLALVHAGDGPMAEYTATYIGPAVASGTNPPNDLPAYLPLRKADDGAA